MAARSAAGVLRRTLDNSRPSTIARSAKRARHFTTQTHPPHAARPSFTLLKTSSRPILSSTIRPAVTPPSIRTIFIQTEETPNADALKFKPNTRILPETLGTPFIEYLTPRSTLQPPHPSPLAAQLLSVEGVTAVFYGADYITITKDPAAHWAHVKPEVFALITETITNGHPIVNTSASATGSGSAVGSGAADGVDGSAAERDSLAYDENDDEVVGMIKELLETRIRPAIQEDGGDIDFKGFVDGQVLLKLRGACRTCDSSTVTLKNGIESMLCHYIEEVQGVQQVLDPEEEVAMQEFAKFEEKLKQQKDSDAVKGTTGKGTLDTAP